MRNVLSKTAGCWIVLLGLLLGDLGVLAQEAPAPRPEVTKPNRAGQPGDLKRLRIRLNATPGHVDSVPSVQFATDGVHALTLDHDGDCRLWDVPAGREVRKLAVPGAKVTACCFVPDSTSVVLGMESGEARLIDVATGAELRCFRGHKGAITDLAVSSKDKQLLTGSADKTSRLWDMASGKELRQFKGPRIQYSPSNQDLSFSSDGNFILIRSTESIGVWETASGKELQRIAADFDGLAWFTPDGNRLIVQNLGSVKCFSIRRAGAAPEIIFEPRKPDKRDLWNKPIKACSDNGEMALIVDTNGRATIWDTVRAKSLGQLEVGQSIRCYYAAFSRDSKVVLTASSDGAVRLWDVMTQKELRRYEGIGDVNKANFSPDGKMVRIYASSQYSPGISYFPDAIYAVNTTQDRVIHRLHCRRQSAFPLLSTDGKMFVDAVILDAQSGKGGCTAWETATAIKLRDFEGIPFGVLSNDGKRLVTYNPDERSPKAQVLEVSTGKAIQRFQISKEPTRALMFLSASPDGRLVLFSKFGMGAYVYEVASGKELESIGGGGELHGRALLSPDGKWILAASSSDGAVRLWEVASGRELRRFEADEAAMGSVALSPDGKLVLTGCSDKTARLWEVANGKEIRRLEGHKDAITSVDFSPDGKLALTGSGDNSARLWEVASGKELRRFEGHKKMLNAVAFSPDGKVVLTGSEDKTARLWEVASGKEIRRFDGPDEDVFSVAFSPDGKLALTGSNDDTARVWEVASGKELSCFKGLKSIAFSPDGRLLLTSGADRDLNRAVRLWDVQTGKEIRHFEGWGLVPYSTEGVGTFAANGRSVLISHQRGASLFELKTGKLLGESVLTRGVSSAAFSPDGSLVFLGLWNSDCDGLLWDVNTRTVLRKCTRSVPPDEEDGVSCCVFSADGKLVLTGSRRRTVRLWEVGSGKEIRRFEGHESDIKCVAFSPDGKLVLTGSDDKTARLWEVASGKELRRFEGHESGINSIAFASEGKQVLTASGDGTVRVWDAATGKELCRRIGFADGNWVVCTPEGLYDAPNAGDGITGAHWIVEQDGKWPRAVDLVQYRKDYLYPKLWERIRSGERPMPPSRLDEALLVPPNVEMDTTGLARGRLKLGLKDDGSGIGEVELFVNAASVERLSFENGLLKPAGPDRAEAIVRLDKHHAWMVPNEPTSVQLRCWDKNGTVYQPTTVVSYTRPTSSEQVRDPRFWALCVGTGEFRNPAMNLQYAGGDAVAMGRALEAGARHLLRDRRDLVSVRILSTANPSDLRQYDCDDKVTPPTREALETALRWLVDSAQPQDLVVIYFSGHGVSHGDYYYVLGYADTADGEALAGHGDGTRKVMTLAGRELLGYLGQVKARKKALILDTCASGRFGELALAERSGNLSLQQLRLEQLRDATGFYVLAGSASDKVSWEASCYGQGLLTYSLLEGLQGGAVESGDPFVNIERWFVYATTRVPDLARGLKAVQQPQLTRPPLERGSGSYPIAKVDDRTKSMIPLSPKLPILVRAMFQSRNRPGDKLGLTSMFHRHLRDLEAKRFVESRGSGSTADPSAGFVFVDAPEMAGAFQVSGNYVQDNGGVKVHVVVSRDGQDVAEFEQAGSSDVSALARDLLDRLLKDPRLRKDLDGR